MSVVAESNAHRLYGVTDDHAVWCREVINFEEREDAVPCLNGVAVGQQWQNIHTGVVCVVTQIRLGGLATHTAHYESIVLLPEDVAPDTLDSGWALWSMGEHWQLVENGKRVEPQPEVWPSRDVVPAAAIASRVRHDRPAGTSVSWVGERKTRWCFYENGILVCDGLVVAKSYAEDPNADLTRRYPLCKPGPTAARGASLEAAVGSLASRWKQRATPSAR